MPTDDRSGGRHKALAKRGTTQIEFAHRDVRQKKHSARLRLKFRSIAVACSAAFCGRSAGNPRVDQTSHSQGIDMKVAPAVQRHCTRCLTVKPQRQRAMRPVAPHATAQTALAGARLQPSDAVLRTLRSVQGIAFDVDSTLCEDESIDELAAYVGAGEAVAELTRRAMGGTMTFQEALGARLALMNVSRQQVEAFLRDHPPRLSKDIPELVARLQELQKEVFLVSGGFRPIINPIADMLHIPRDNVYANTILYKEDADGSYAGFDADEFTSSSGGKAAAVRHIKAKHSLSSMVMIGDGATDLEARQPGGADLFIGYGGTVVRDNVAAAADWFVYDIQDILDALG